MKYNLPERPGVYIFKDRNRKPIYVGKAANLKSRVDSYFNNRSRLGPKTAALIMEINRVDYIETDSTVEALLLEADLIKKSQPYYNIKLKDGKNYSYIALTKETFPKVYLTREVPEPGDKNEYFGPFPESGVFKLLRILRRIFPFRDCGLVKYIRQQKLGRPCLYGPLNLCPAPCQKAVSPADYKSSINQLKSFIRGRKRLVTEKLMKEMKQSAAQLDFEKAEILCHRLELLNNLKTAKYSPREFLSNPNLISDRGQRELDKLQAELTRTGYGIKGLKRIEAYDISNLNGEKAVAALVVFEDGLSVKDQYRRFRIKTVFGPDDPGMIKEVIKRRLVYIDSRNSQNAEKKRKDQSFSKRPDLILVDGGIGQVSAAAAAMREAGMSIPVIGLEKKMELIVTEMGHRLRLPGDNPGLNLLRRIRDEAHRFAVSYHRNLRRRSVFF